MSESVHAEDFLEVVEKNKAESSVHRKAMHGGNSIVKVEVNNNMKLVQSNDSLDLAGNIKIEGNVKLKEKNVTVTKSVLILFCQSVCYF